jgi:hypothetical protein
LPQPPNLPTIHQNCQKGQNWPKSVKFCQRAKFAFKTPLKFDQISENLQNCQKWQNLPHLSKIAKIGQKLANLLKWPKMPKFTKIAKKGKIGQILQNLHKGQICLQNTLKI